MQSPVLLSHLRARKQMDSVDERDLTTLRLLSRQREESGKQKPGKYLLFYSLFRSEPCQMK